MNERKEQEVGNLPDGADIEWIHIGGNRYVMCIFKKNGNYYASTYTTSELVDIRDELTDLIALHND